jgi:peptidyl-prolyl cis-trans isomerase-like 4
VRDKEKGESLGYAFIDFETKESCEMAYLKMENVIIDDRRIHVDFSQSVAKLWNDRKQRKKKRSYKDEESDRKRHKEDSRYDNHSRRDRDERREEKYRDDSRRYRDERKEHRYQDDRYNRESRRDDRGDDRSRKYKESSEDENYKRRHESRYKEFRK